MALDINIDSNIVRSKSEEPFQEEAGDVDLESAELLVSVGRGIESEDNLPTIQSLADAMGAEVASSRPVVDMGWLPPYRQVGSSGQVVSPKLYFSCGVSGAIQHVVGMKGSKNVLAINKDEDAPIFQVADYGLVGDLFKIIPDINTPSQNKVEKLSFRFIELDKYKRKLEDNKGNLRNFKFPKNF